MKEIILYGVFVNIPYFIVFLVLYSYLFGFQNKMPIEKIIQFCLIISFLDATYKINIPEFQMYALAITMILLLILMFKFNPLNALVTLIITFAVDIICQLTVNRIFYICGIDMNQLTDNLFYTSIFTYVFLIIEVIIILILYKTGKSIKLFKNHQIFSDLKFEKAIDTYIAHIAPVFVIFVLSLSTAYTALMYDTKFGLDRTFYFTLVLIINICFAYFYIKQSLEIKKYMKDVKNYKNLWEQSEVYKNIHCEKSSNEN